MDLADARVVSFDLFDTLLVRPLATPADLFLLLEPEATALCGSAVPNFVRARKEARKWAKERGSDEHGSNEHHGEEVTLDQRYRAIGAKFGLEKEVVQALSSKEMELDRRLLRPHPLGKARFEEAKRAGKRVVIVSDTYYPRHFIEQLLVSNGYEGYEQLFLSSESGKLKSSGTLFEHMLSQSGVSAAEVLHIGDAKHGDIVPAKQRGISALHQRSPAQLLKRDARGPEPYVYSNALTQSVVRGLVARRLLAAETHEKRAATLNMPEELGYRTFGPLLLGFVAWLCSQAKSQRVDHLFFLSRDGHVIQRAYQLFRALDESLPPSTYLYGSRRALCVPALRTEAELLELLERPYQPMPLKALFRRRFGLHESIVAKAGVAAFGFEDLDVQVHRERDRKKLTALVRRLAPELLQNAASERDLYLQYLAERGFRDAQRPTVVDIGHLGTLQTALGRIVESDAVGGFYFASTRGIDALSLPQASYVGATSTEPQTLLDYEPRIALFELLFLNNEDTVNRMERIGSEWLPRTEKGPSHDAQREFALSVHEGAIAFLQDAIDVLGPRAFDVAMTPSEAIRPALALFEQPSRAEAACFLRLRVESLFAGKPPAPVISTKAGGPPLWQEGFDAWHGKRSKTSRLRANVQRRALSVADRLGLMDNPKTRKLLRDPKGFVRDGKTPVLRLISRLWK